jgi:hypothetical protein
VSPWGGCRIAGSFTQIQHYVAPNLGCSPDGVLTTESVRDALGALRRPRADLHVGACARIFDQPVDGVWVTDQFGVVADLAVPTRTPTVVS